MSFNLITEILETRKSGYRNKAIHNDPLGYNLDRIFTEKIAFYEKLPFSHINGTTLILKVIFKVFLTKVQPSTIILTHSGRLWLKVFVAKHLEHLDSNKYNWTLSVSREISGNTWKNQSETLKKSLIDMSLMYHRILEFLMDEVLESAAKRCVSCKPLDSNASSATNMERN